MIEANSKYEPTGEMKIVDGVELYRIRAVKDFGSVARGDIGGWIQSTLNLSEKGDCWVGGDAQVYGNAWVNENAWVYGNAQVFGNAWVSENAHVFGSAQVFGYAHVFGSARVIADAWVYGNAHVFGNAWVGSKSRITSTADVLCVGPIGSEHGYITFSRSDNDVIYVNRGCFNGTLDEFISRVNDIHGNNRHGMSYRALAEFAKLHLSR